MISCCTSTQEICDFNQRIAIFIFAQLDCSAGEDTIDANGWRCVAELSAKADLEAAACVSTDAFRSRTSPCNRFGLPHLLIIATLTEMGQEPISMHRL